MTTTESPALPEWEAAASQHQNLPYADDATSRDPGYIYARLQHALRRAHAIGEEQRRDGYGGRWLHELTSLRQSIEGLAGEMRLRSAQADEFLTVLEAVAPEFNWNRGGSFHTSVHGETNERAAAACARQLRLTERPEGQLPDFRTRTWDGTHEGWPVTIYFYALR